MTGPPALEATLHRDPRKMLQEWEDLRTKRRKPEIRQYFPIWWHHHGCKVQVRSVSDWFATPKSVELAGSAAFLTLEKDAERHQVKVSWRVVQWHGNHEASGFMWMNYLEVATAFGLAHFTFPSGGWLLERFGGDVAEQKKFIRWQQFLNIPCPGTGHDGDPNISIELRDEIKAVVADLIEF